MTAEYIVLNKIFGLSLDSPGDTDQIIKFMSMLLVGLPYLLLLFFCVRIAGWFVSDPLARLMMLGALAFGTQLWGYATNLNNHVPGAFTTVMAIYFGLGLIYGKLAPAPWRFFLFGVFAGLTPTLDMPITVFVAPVGLYLLYRFPMQSVVFAGVGAAIPLGVQSSVLYAYTGSIFPVQMNKEFYLYQTSFWRNPVGIDCLNEPKGVYLFHMTFGRAGLFSLFPILLAGVAAAIRAAFKRNTPARRPILIAAGCLLTLTAYYALTTNNYGGEAYGFRWYIGAMPVLMLMGAVFFQSMLSNDRRRPVTWRWAFIGVMLGISFYSAWECTVTPWASNTAWTINFLGRSYY